MSINSYRANDEFPETKLDEFEHLVSCYILHSIHVSPFFIY